MRRTLAALLTTMLAAGPVTADDYIRFMRANMPVTGGIFTGNVELRNPASLAAESHGQPVDFSAGWTTDGAICVINAGSVKCTGPGTGTFTQTSAAAASNGGVAWASSGINGWFVYTPTISNVADTPACTRTSAFGTAVSLSNATATYQFQAAATTPGDFVVSCVLDAGETIWFDAVSLKQIIGGSLTVQGRLLIRGGMPAAPAIAAIAWPTTGFYWGNSTFLSPMINGTATGYFGSGKWVSPGMFWLSTPENAGLSSFAAATVQLGEANAAAPIAQTLTSQGCRGGIDSNCAGKQMTVGPTATSGGTGLGLPAGVTINRGLILSTGAGSQPASQAFIACGSKALSTTSAQAQTIATISTSTTTAGSVQMYYSTMASDGTIVDVDSGNVGVSWNNGAGTAAAGMSAVFGASSFLVAPDTLASTPTATVATNVVSINLTPTWTNTTPTLVRGYATFLVNTFEPVAVVCQ